MKTGAVAALRLLLDSFLLNDSGKTFGAIAIGFACHRHCRGQLAAPAIHRTAGEGCTAQRTSFYSVNISRFHNCKSNYLQV